MDKLNGKQIGEKHYTVPASMKNIFISLYQKKMFRMPIDGNMEWNFHLLYIIVLCNKYLLSLCTTKYDFTFTLFCKQTMNSWNATGKEQNNEKYFFILFERSDYDVEKIQSYHEEKI